VVFYFQWAVSASNSTACSIGMDRTSASVIEIL
jgi:hypothetical protein